MFTLEQLKVFRKVAELGSFNKAAEEEFVTPNAIMKNVNNLETELGVKLFDRSHKGQTLTKAGESLYKDSKHILDFVAASTERAVQASREDKEIIRVGSSVWTPPEMYTLLIRDAQKRSSEFRFEIVPLEVNPESSAVTYKALGARVDIIASTFDEIISKFGNYNGKELMKVPLCATVSLNHRLAGRESVTLSDLHGEKLIMLQRGRSNVTDELRRQILKEHPEIIVEEIPSYNMEVYNRVANSDDIFIGNGKEFKPHPFIDRIPITDAPMMPFGVLYSKNPSRAVQKFIEELEPLAMSKGHID